MQVAGELLGLRVERASGWISGGASIQPQKIEDNFQAENRRKIEQITAQLAQLQQGSGQGKCHCIHVDQFDLLPSHCGCARPIIGNATARIPDR